MGGGDEFVLPLESAGIITPVNEAAPADDQNVTASEVRASTVVPEATAVPYAASVRAGVATADVTCSVNPAGVSEPSDASSQGFHRVGSDPGIFGVDEAYQPAANDGAERNPFEGLVSAASAMFGMQQSFPDYLSDETRTAALEETGFARVALAARADEWRAEKDKAKAERRHPDLGVKFIYAW